MVARTLLLSLAIFLLACGAESSSPSRVDFRTLEKLKNADILRANDSSLGDYLKDPALTAVTREFGPSVLTTNSLPYRSGAVQAKVKPWSSWWYPTKSQTAEANQEGGSLSAIGKYDLFRNLRAGMIISRAREIEEKKNSGNAYAWEGLCDAWSLAAISVPEPKHPVDIAIDGTTIHFTVGDLKYLALKTFEAIDDADLKYYGQKFTGDDRGWVFPDIFPEEFHRFLEVQLFQRQEAFIMDHDPGVQIWNVPVYKANFLMETVPNDPNAVFVRTWLYSAENTTTDNRDAVGTKEMIREYDYILQGTRNEAGNLEVKSGYWVVGPSGINSREDHPDFFFKPVHPGATKRKSWNPQIDVHVVDEILSQSY